MSFVICIGRISKHLEGEYARGLGRRLIRI